MAGRGVRAADASSPLFGRSSETNELRASLERARSGQGQVWAIVGPGGMGKTRLLRSLEEDGRGLGFQVRTTTCLKESLAPFFPLEQVFRHACVAPSTGGRSASAGPQDRSFPPFQLVEEERPRRFWSIVEARAGPGNLLVATRERPASLRQARPALQDGTSIVWVTRLEGPDHIAPGALDQLGERLETHLRGGPGRTVALEGIEYLISQGSFPPVLRLLQLLNDVASESGGHLLVALNPASLETREVSLMESDAEVVREASAEPPGATRGGPTSQETPALTLLRYLSTLEELSAGSPQLLLMDDLQWADPQSVSAFQFLARNLSGLPVVLVGALREEDSKDRTSFPNGLDEVRDGLAREGLLRTLTLRGLRQGEAQELACSLVGVTSLEQDPPDAIARIVHRTEGNPYFLREILLQLVEGGRLRGGPQGGSLDLPASEAGEEGNLLPGSIRRLVVRRLESLTTEERKVLECASVAGSEFDLAPVAAALDLPLPTVREIVQRLHRVRRLVEPEGDRWGCAHPLVWEVTLSDMEPARRREFAERLAKWWTVHRPLDIEACARLLYEARAGDLAREWIVRAIRSAIDRSAVEVAGTYLQWVRQLRRSSGTERWDLWLEEVRTAFELDGRGNPRVPRDTLQALLSEGPPFAMRAEVLADLAICLRDLSLKEADERAREVIEMSQRSPGEIPSDVVAKAHLARGASLIALQQWEPALEQEQLAVKLLEGRPPSPLGATTNIQVAFALSFLHRWDEARVALERGLEIARACDDAGKLAAAMNTRGAIASNAGDFSGGYLDFLEAYRQSRRIGQMAGCAISLANAASHLNFLGDALRAERLARVSLDIALKFGVLRAEVSATSALARSLKLQRRFPEARAAGERSRLLSHKVGHHEYDVEATILSHEVEGEITGDLQGALAKLDHLAATIPRRADSDEHIQMWTTMADFATRLKDPARAKGYLERGRQAFSLRSGNQYQEALFVDLEARIARLEGRLTEAEATEKRSHGLMQLAERSWPKDPPGLSLELPRARSAE